MNYSIKLEKTAFKSLAKINKPDRVKIINAIDKLKKNSELGKPLTGKWKGLKRLRSGNYRIIYGVKDTELIILVVRIGHRRDIYR